MTQDTDREPYIVTVRRRAGHRCTHCIKLCVEHGAPRPGDGHDEQVQWCSHNIGPRWVDWYYRGGGVWCFHQHEDMIQFRMVWE